MDVTKQEKKDLVYIVHSLARNSWTSILSDKSALKKAGDRIGHLHPLRFLMTVFTDEELKADISAVRGRSLVWKNFYEGLENSFKQESQKNNIPQEFVDDFAARLGIDVALVTPLINESRWKDFIDTLIDKVPRSGNPGRYDM